MKKESRAQYEYNMWKHRKNTELKYQLKHSKDSIVQTSRGNYDIINCLISFLNRNYTYFAWLL